MNDIQLEFEATNNKKYEVDGIWKNAIYTKEWIIKQLPRLYYLVLWKSYLKKKNNW